MTTTRALTCRAVADHPPAPADDRPAVPGAAPTRIPRWTHDRRSYQAQVEATVPEDLSTSVRNMNVHADRAERALKERLTELAG